MFGMSYCRGTHGRGGGGGRPDEPLHQGDPRASGRILVAYDDHHLGKDGAPPIEIWRWDALPPSLSLDIS
jgi:hypothetical protein